MFFSEKKRRRRRRKKEKKKKERTEAATKGVFLKKKFLRLSQSSEENTCARVSFLIKLGLFLQYTSERLLLKERLIFAPSVTIM